jgi:hypothetical protein
MIETVIQFWQSVRELFNDPQQVPWIPIVACGFGLLLLIVCLVSLRRDDPEVFKTGGYKKTEVAGRSPSGSGSFYGGFLIFCGAAALVYFESFFDVSVSAGELGRVANFQLMPERQIGIIVGFGRVLVGLLVMILKKMVSAR